MSEFVKEVSDSSFEKDVLGASKPVLVDFWAEWCALAVCWRRPLQLSRSIMPIRRAW